MLTVATVRSTSVWAVDRPDHASAPLEVELVGVDGAHSDSIS
jgi:hypothetical protein